MQSSWTLGKVVDWTTAYLNGAEIPDARLDAELLLSHVLNCKRLQLYLIKDEPVAETDLKRFKELIIGRRSRKPVSYLLGEHQFMGLNFSVNCFTLIPRPETELLVEEIQSFLKSRPIDILLEIGTGSGNIAVALAKLTQAHKVYSSDISIEALRVAQANVDANGVSGKVTLRRGDLFEAFAGDALEGRVDMIVSNPPYIADSEKGGLAPELSFEPVSALFGGEDGLDFYRSIAGGAGKYLKKGGFLAFEMNAYRSAQIQAIVSEHGFDILKVVKDYSALERVVIAQQR